MKKICCLIICYLLLPISLSAKIQDASPSYAWGKLECIWGCSFKSCRNVVTLRHCNENCNPSYIQQCLIVAKDAFGDLLPQALKPLPAVKIASKEDPQSSHPSEKDDDED